ncbi:MAG: hypothetical protein P0Y62_02230 [Candidatus Chryseobacterium colombiense]|nr:hypothetical protein [Chryseobacterium sp.]WEK70375.1 MAG: hypothetical protein P0Y62_02230 [Chryseobacterium sp.]
MKIALLLPRSVIYPSISFDIMDGFKQSLKNMGLEGYHEIISAGIGVAAKHEEIYQRCEQFLIEGADVIIGYMSPIAAEFVNPLFQAADKTLLVLDSGYHFPAFDGKLSHTYFISLQGTLCTRVIVNQAIEQGYKNFAFTCSFYDAGYRPSYIYSIAVEEKGGTIGFNHITSLRRSEFTLAPLREYIEREEQTAVLATFCGDMAEDFFSESNTISAGSSVYGTCFTADELWLKKIPYPGKDWNSAVAWSQTLETSENKTFLHIMNGIREGKANLFSLLGWEAALFIGMENIRFDGISIDSPRGRVWMNPDNGFTEAPVYYATVIKAKDSENCELTDVHYAAVTESERESLKINIKDMQNTEANTWFNAYGCLES